MKQPMVAVATFSLFAVAGCGSSTNTVTIDTTAVSDNDAVEEVTPPRSTQVVTVPVVTEPVGTELAVPQSVDSQPVVAESNAPEWDCQMNGGTGLA